MSGGAAPVRAYLSIGEVLAALRPEFPDVTISKIRFLESEGLVEPRRTPSGYRKFSHEDVGRLRYVLTAQRDHYLPLRVIKDHLEAIDRGLEPPLPGGGPRVPRPVLATTLDPAGLDRDVDLKLSREELLASSGLDDKVLGELERFGVIASRAGYYDADASLVATVVARLAGYGLEPRHLRGFRTAADREVGLVEAVVTPLLRQRNPEAQGRAEEAASELAALAVQLHAALVKAGVRRLLSR